jgi:cell division GTPase FtsZ
MLKDDFCAIGIGQGGGKMANCFYQNKYRSFFINTSFDDLSQLNIDNFNFLYQPPGSKGCAKQRKKAQQYAKDYYEVMIKKLLDAHTTCKVYIVHYTLGGGTGGGLSNMFNALLRMELQKRKRHDSIIIAVVAKPKKHESYQIQKNAEECLDELINMNKKGIVNQYYVINNDSRNDITTKTNDKGEEITQLDVINEEHFLLFDRWIEGENANNKNNTDESERMDLFRLSGQAMMFEFDGNDESKFKERMQKAYDNSIYCKPIKNPQGVGLALNESISEEVAFPIIEDIVGVFPQNHTTPTKVSNMIMISGLKENKSIKNEIAKIANEKAEKINKSENEDEEEIKIVNVNSKTAMKNDSNETDDIMDVKDIWSMFK